jgi:acetylornithine deacetylase/succinyl-diaminopimelate desuccinylase-like protein
MARGAAPALFPAEPGGETALREFLQWFSQNKKWINERQLEICRIPAPTFQEADRAAWIAAEWRALGWEVKIDRAGNVIAHRPQLKPKSDIPLVALTAHLDTVLAPRSTEDITLGRDGRFLGPGVSDNGSGLAGLLAMAKLISDSPRLAGLPLPLMLVANVGEEGEGDLNGMRYFCRPGGSAARAGAFVVLDGPSLDHITARALASRRFEITVAGPGGHSWSDFGAGNPVHALAHAIALFCEHASLISDKPRTTFNFGIIDGGTSVNAIPAQAGAKLDLRSESTGRIDELIGLLILVLERALERENAGARNGKARLSVKMREIGSRPGGALDDGAPLLCHARAVDSLLGIRSHIDCASTDANVPLSLGIPAISIGAGGTGGGAHTPNEWYHPDGREKGLSRVFLLLLRLMAGADPTLSGRLA